MTEYMPGGRRRIDHILDPAFTDVTDVADDEISERLAEADQEETDLSYARRLLQGRMDLLYAERDRRAGKGPLAGGPKTDDQLAAAFGRIFGYETRKPPRGLGRRLPEPSRVGDHRREVEAAVARLMATGTQTEEQLGKVLTSLEELDDRVSRTRRLVQDVVDALVQALTERMRANPRFVALLGQDEDDRAS